MTDTSTSLSDLATRYPAASRVFHRNRLDFCCGGQRSLVTACQEAGLDADALMAEIVSSAGASDAPDLAELDTYALVSHILSRYHEPLRSELPRLEQMATKVERVHAEKEGCPKGLAAHLRAWTNEVLDHLEKEESVLFPSIESPDPSVVAALFREHIDHAGALSRTRQLTDDLTPPAEACTTWRALYLGLSDLERELMEHVHIENNILFPRVMAR